MIIKTNTKNINFDEVIKHLGDADNTIELVKLQSSLLNLINEEEFVMDEELDEINAIVEILELDENIVNNALNTNISCKEDKMINDVIKKVVKDEYNK